MAALTGFGEYPWVYCAILSCARGTQSICKHNIHQTCQQDLEVYSALLSALLAGWERLRLNGWASQRNWQSRRHDSAAQKQTVLGSLPPPNPSSSSRCVVCVFRMEDEGNSCSWFVSWQCFNKTQKNPPLSNKWWNVYQIKWGGYSWQIMSIHSDTRDTDYTPSGRRMIRRRLPHTLWLNSSTVITRIGIGTVRVSE